MLIGNGGLPVSLIVCVLLVILRTIITLPIDPFLSVAVIEIAILGLRKITVVNRILGSCKQQSANVWLIHGYIGGIISQLYFRTIVDKYLFLMFVALAISIMINQLKQEIYYNALVKIIRSRVSN